MLRRLGPLAVVLAVGCGVPFIMPTAKVDLAGYKVVTGYSEGVAVVQGGEDRRRGFVDRDGAIVLAPRFDTLGVLREGLAPARTDYWEPFGYVDRAGEVRIAPRFEAALGFSEGLAPVRLGGQWGYVDRAGEFRVPPRYAAAFAFAGGRGRVVRDGLAGFVDASGREVVPPVYFRAEDFSDGLAMVCDAHRCGFVDEAGRVAVEPRFDDAGSFAEGLAPVRVGELWGYVDRTGQVVVAPAFTAAAAFSDGLARVGVSKGSSYSRKFGGYSGRATFFGFIDPSGAPAFATEMLGVEPFRDGIAVVRLPAGGLCSDCNMYRFMTRDGTFLPGRFDQASSFADGRAVVKVGERSYVVDRSGSPVVALDWSLPGDSEAAIRNTGRTAYGYIAANGETVLPHAYVEAEPFSEGLALVAELADRSGRRRRFVDRGGRVVLEVGNEVALMLPFVGGLALRSEHTAEGMRWGYMDRDGALAIPCRYAGASFFAEGLAAVKLTRDLGADDWGYVDATGGTVIAPAFRAAGPFANGLASVEWVTPDHILHSGVIDRSGRVVVESPFLPELQGALFGGPSLPQLALLRRSSLAEGLIPKLAGGEVGWVDASGAWVVREPRFDWVGTFSEGRATVHLRGQYDGGWGWVDRSGALVGDAVHARVEPFSEGLALVRDAAGRSGWVDVAGAWVIAPMWLEEARAFTDGLALVRVNGFWGYLDRAGRFAVPARYVRAEPFSEGLAVAAVAVAEAPGKAARGSAEAEGFVAPGQPVGDVAHGVGRAAPAGRPPGERRLRLRAAEVGDQAP